MASGVMTILRCGVLVDGSGVPASEDMGVVIDGDEIAAVAPWNELGIRGGYRDLRRCSVVPGLIDGHTHICLGSPSSPSWAAAAGDPIGLVTWGLASSCASLLSGVTTVVDAGSRDGLALRVGTLIKSGIAVGPRVLAAGPAITTTGGHGASFGVRADNVDELLKAVRANVSGGADYVKIMVTGGAITPQSNRRRSQYRQDELDAAIADAHRLNRKVIGHANCTEGITRAVQAGIDIVAHCNWLGEHPGTVEMDPHTVELMAAQGTWIDLNIQGAFRDIEEADGRVVSAHPGEPTPRTRWELLRPLAERGIGIYLTSDGFGPSVGSFTGQLSAVESRDVPSPEGLISHVTSIPAKALGLAKRLGSLQAGKLADLVVLDGDLRADRGCLAKPLSVFRSGIEVVSNGLLRRPPLLSRASAEMDAQEDLLARVFGELD